MATPQYLIADKAISGNEAPLYSAAMEWAEMRRHYARLFNAAKKRGETQETIAARGGIRQNKISELMSNDRLGPRVETFVKAVDGLGISISEFFAQIERPANSLLQNEMELPQNPPHSSEADHGRSLSTVVDAILLEKIVISAAEIVSDAVNGLAARLEQTAGPHPRKTSDRRADSSKPRKTG